MNLRPHLANSIFVGDRIAEVARLFNIHPQGLIGGEIPMIDYDYPLTEHLECVSCAFGKKKNLLPHAFKKMGAQQVILENAPEKSPNPAELRQSLEEKKIPVRVVDFSKGAVRAIEETGAILGLPKEAKKIAAQYTADLAKFTPPLSPKAGGGVVIFLGISSPRHPHTHLLLETPGCAADKTLLPQFGLKNVGAPLMNDEPVCLDGIQLLKSISCLEKAAPEIIILTGDPRPAQHALAQAVKGNPLLATSVPALAKQQIFSLPHYCHALEFRLPQTLRAWADGLSLRDQTFASKP